ncbi:hypothetical protein [Glutamicibacter sp.]|uniref:hypothetical protein n=1 Tax=Glutamicibacter sp. TaxID=1931995 RepID=UPI0028BD2D83|nr:hypothetical protein [Glutamicibacter sp.]
MALDSVQVMISETKFAYQSVKVRRDSESKTIAKKAKSGWDLESQEPAGAHHTTLKFRRVKKEISRASWVLLGIVGILILALFVVLGIFEDRINGKVADAPSVSQSLADAALSASGPVQLITEEN